MSAASELQARLASALVLVGVALGTAGVGGALFAIVWGMAGAVVAFEWQRLVAPDGWRYPTAVSAAGCAAVAAAAMARAPAAALAAAVLAPAAAALLAAPGRRATAALGALVALGFVFAVVVLRGADRAGLLVVLWLFAVVWGADTGAYFAGRAIGGPRLAPAVSPNKTWSGFVCGVVSGAGAGWLVLRVAGFDPGPVQATLGAGIALISALGDLGESWFKRLCGAKDSGVIIPGHGGFLDRLDGFVVAAVAASAVGLARGGVEGAALGVLRW